GDRITGVPLDLADLVRADRHVCGQLVDGGIAAELHEHVAAPEVQPGEQLADVHRDPDGAGLVGQAAADRLADPPGGVGGELVAHGVIELLDRVDEADGAFLDEVEEGHAAPPRSASQPTRPAAGWPRPGGPSPARRRGRASAAPGWSRW